MLLLHKLLVKQTLSPINHLTLTGLNRSQKKIKKNKIDSLACIQQKKTSASSVEKRK